MPQVLIRNLDAALLARLKRRAKANGRSLEAELRRILAESFDEPGSLTLAEFIKATAPLRRKSAARKQSDSAKLLRSARRRA